MQTSVGTPRVAHRAAANARQPATVQADAAEVQSTMYDCFLRLSRGLRHARGVAAESPIQRMFGLDVSERVVCARCAKATHVLSYSTFFHIVHAASLRAAAAAAPAASFEQRLASILGEDCTGCDTDVGGCGRPTPISHALTRQPEVFTISLAWESNAASEEEVATTLAALSPVLQPLRVYASSEAPPEGALKYELRGMVCYYGSHYASFVRTDTRDAFGFAPPGPASWTKVDDASVSEVGSWEALRDACARGHLQPTVLFYERTMSF